MASFLKYFSGSQPSTTTDDSSSAVRALPGSWYTSDDMYELEKRAVFSRKWQLITHSCRLSNAGDTHESHVAGFYFTLVKDEQDTITGSRICPIAAAAVPIHVHVDVNGFVWVNLDSKRAPEIAWEQDFDGIDKQDRYKQFNFDNYEFDHFWEMEGPYNWKILADNYNECYHCATTHPDIPALADLKSYNVNTRDMSIVHDAATTDEQRANGLVVASTYYWPNASTNISPHFFMIQRFVPTGTIKSSMQYQVFRNKHSSNKDFDLVSQIYKRIMSEDKVLCQAAQRNINAGIFVNGEMHPRLEKGPLYFQKLCRDSVVEHFERERAVRKQIWPAEPQEETVARPTAGLVRKDLGFFSGGANDSATARSAGIVVA